MDLHELDPGGIRRFTRGEFHDMERIGMFAGEQVELLRGLLVTMNPEGVRHADLVEWLTERFILALGGAYAVRPGLPIATDDSEPRPDLFVGPKLTRPREDHPHEALLVIEVAKTSLRRDRNIKRAIYAEAQIPEYWIIDLSEDDQITVEVYTEPSGSAYARQQVLHDGDVLRPTKVPLEIAVADLPR